MAQSLTLLIARHEFRQLQREGRFRVAAAFTLLLFVTAFATGWQDYQQSATLRQQAAETVRAQWLNQGVKHPHLGAHLGFFVFKEELPLAVLDPGLKPYIGAFLPLETHDRSNFRERPADDSSAAARFGQLTAATVLQFLLPLLVIFLMHSVITGEHENGTLAQLLASGVSRWQLALGKLLGNGAVLALLLIPAAALGSVTMLRSTELSALRFLLMTLAYLGYLLIFVLLALAVSAWARNSQLALVILLAFWVGNSFLLPRLAASLAQRLAPTPSAEEFRAAINHSLNVGVDGKDEAGAHFKNLVATTLERYGVKRVEDLPVGYAGIMLKDSDQRFERIYEHHYRQLYATYQRQRGLHYAASLLGPLIAMRELSRGLTGMDIAHYEHFADAAERYRRAFVERTNEAAEKQAHGTGWELQVGREFWESIPPFRYEMPNWQWALAHNGLSLLVLALWLALAASCAVISLRKLSMV